MSELSTPDLPGADLSAPDLSGADASAPDPAGADDQGTPSTTGGAPSGGPELGDDLAQEAQTGISSPDAEEHAGEMAPASEGRAPE